MKTKLGLLLLMLLIAVGCDDSAEIAKLREQVEDLQKQATEPTAEQPNKHTVEQPTEPTAEQPTERPQPEPVPVDPSIIEQPSITNTIGMTLKEIPAGTFMMGSPTDETGRYDIEQQHKVTISKPF